MRRRIDTVHVMVGLIVAAPHRQFLLQARGQQQQAADVVVRIRPKEIGQPTGSFDGQRCAAACDAAQFRGGLSWLLEVLKTI